MKENSIERDMHLLESYAGMTHKMNDNQGRPKLDQAIEHILRDYKRVLKENEYMHNELNKQQTTINKYAKENEELKDFKKQVTYIENTNFIKYKNYISKQKVKDAIEEYNNEIGQLRIERNVTYDSGIYKLELKREALQELLEKE